MVILSEPCLHERGQDNIVRKGLEYMGRWLYVIADLSYGEKTIAAVLEAGVDLIQLREKDISSAEYLMRAKKLREMTKRFETKLVINDRLDIAALCGADGVHLGQSDIPVADARRFFGSGKIIGCTAKTVKQAEDAVAAGADYLGSGAWFPTDTKKDAAPILEETYRGILKAAPIPNVAIGGITAENAWKPLSCGAGGLAVSAGIFQAEDPVAEVRKLRSLLNSYEDGGGR